MFLKEIKITVTVTVSMGSNADTSVPLFSDTVKIKEGKETGLLHPASNLQMCSQ